MPPCISLQVNRGNAPINSVLQHPSRGQSPGILTFEDWIVQILVPASQNSVQIPYPIVGFVCQMPLLKNNRQLLSSLVKLVDKHTNMSHDHLHDDAIYKNTTLY